MPNRALLAVAAAASQALAFAQQLEISKWDPDMAISRAVVSNGVKWIDGTLLPIEGRAFDDVQLYYDRLPSNLTKRVNYGVAEILKHDTAGMQFRFVTDSKSLHLRWTPLKPKCYMDHMPATGSSGIDVYRFDARKGTWAFVKTGRPRRDGTNLVAESSVDIPWTPGTPCLVNLPLYNGIRSFSLGIDEGATVSAAPPRRSGVVKPVVFYGTSITQGGCASRPGMAFPSIVGRALDVPIVNLGFSGSGRMELEMADVIARIDASCYVLDCLWNMRCLRLKPGDPAEEDLAAAGITDEDTPENQRKYVETRYEKFVRALRAKRPDVPIVMAEACDVFCAGPGVKDLVIRRIYSKLVAEGWRNLVYLPKNRMYLGDGDGTVDGAHATDLGMTQLARAFGAAVKEALFAPKDEQGAAPLIWVDGRDVPLEGRPFDNKTDYYCRLPEPALKDPQLSQIVPAAHFPAGMCFRFKTDSSTLRIEWTLDTGERSPWNVPPCAENGIDVYRWYEGRGWWYVATGNRPTNGNTGMVTMPWSPGAACMVYLPLGARVQSVRFGIDAGSKIEPLGPRASGIDKPVVVYGTSMAHGYCSSRPGMTWSAILSRRMDVPFVNQGYNGQGKLEPPMAGLLAEIDASAYCFLTLGKNMTLEEADERFPKFLRELHKRRPDVPILLGEHYYVYALNYGDGNPKNECIARVVANLKREDPDFWANLYVVKMADMFVADGDGTTDHVHVNDRGASQVADAFGKVLSEALYCKRKNQGGMKK